jgi:hypothetical protein
LASNADPLHESLNMMELLCELLSPLLRCAHCAMNGPDAKLPAEIPPALARNLFDHLAMAVSLRFDDLLAPLQPLLGTGRLDAEFLAHVFRNLVFMPMALFTLSVHPVPGAIDGCVMKCMFLQQKNLRRSAQVRDNAAHIGAVFSCARPLQLCANDVAQA